jgi:DNA-binding NarL/FixJ family response regulator
VNVRVRGLAVELTIEDRPLANRIAALLQDLNVSLVEPGSGEASITISDAVPETGTDQRIILLADDVEISAALRAGVVGVLPKSARITELRIALEAAAQGLAVAPLSVLEDARQYETSRVRLRQTRSTSLAEKWRSLHCWQRAHPTRRSRRSSTYPCTRQNFT